MLDPEFVRHAYLGLLNREPESADIVDFWIKSGLSREQLLAEIVRTPEFQLFRPSRSVEAYFYSPPERIEVHAPPDRLQALFERTRKQWAALGETEPFWSVLTHDEYLSRNIDEGALETFFETGKQHAELIDLCAGRVGDTVPSGGVCLELGCGVGRVTKHLAARFDQVVALDVSPGNLRIAQATMEREGIDNVTFSQIESMADFARLPPFDFFYSFIVLQHNPPPIQYKILEYILSRLRPSGHFLFQTQTYHPGYRFVLDDYLKSAPDRMDMHSLPMHEILGLIDREKGLLEDVREDFWTGVGGSHTFFGRARNLEPEGSERRGSLVVRNRFGWERDLAADLDRVRERLANLSLAPLAPPSEAAPEPEPEPEPEPPILAPPAPAPAAVRRPAWRRLLTYVKSVAQLSGTRHRTAVLEQDLRQVREAVHALDERSRADVRTLTARVRGDLTALGEIVQDQYQLVDAARRQARAESDQALAAGLQWRRDADAEAGRQKALIDQRLGQIAEQLRLERAARLEPPRIPDKAAKTARGRTDADAAAERITETFYALLVSRYRGDRDTIVQRLKVYGPDLEAAAERTGSKGPFIDLGCGRGEFLEVIRDAGLDGQGLDVSDVQLREAMDRGLDAIRADALAHLRGLPDQSVTGISAIHLAEHLPFSDLALLMGEAHRVLRPGGLALFETPYPNNLIAAPTTFHAAPTSAKPLPPEVMQVLLEAVGLAQVEVRPLHPSPTREQVVQEYGLNVHVADLLFGAQDYAVLAVRT